MKIALVSPYDCAYPGGVTEHVAALAAGLQQRGHSVRVLTPCSRRGRQRIVDAQVVTQAVTAVPIGGAVARLGLSPLSFFQTRAILQQEKFDVVHLQEPLAPGLTWWTLLNKPCRPEAVYIGTFHTYHEHVHWVLRWGRPLARRLFNRLDGLIAVSQAARHFAGSMFPGDYHIIPNGVNVQRFGAASRPKAADKFTLLFVGRPDGRKGFATLFEAFMRLKTTFPWLQLQVVGPFNPPARARYQQQAQAQGVTGLEFAGYILPEHLPDFYRRATLFCAPSVGCESFGIVLLEAMAAGVPVIASDIAGYRSVLTHGVEGLLVPPAQPAALAQAIRRLITQPYLRAQMGQRGQLTAQRYSWDNVIDQVLGVYLRTKEQAVQGPVAPHPVGLARLARRTHRRQPTNAERSRTQI